MEVRTATGVEVIGELSLYEFMIAYYGNDGLIEFKALIHELTDAYWDEEDTSLTIIEYIVSQLSLKGFEKRYDYDIYVSYDDEEGDDEW